MAQLSLRKDKTAQIHCRTYRYANTSGVLMIYNLE